MSRLRLKCRTSAGLFRVLKFCNFTTQTHKTYSTTKFTQKQDTIYYRLLPAWSSSASVVPILDQWVSQGNPLDENDLRKIVKQFRSYRRFKHALEISEWISDKNNLDLTPGDVAIKLDLISKVHGPERAEKYFRSIPEHFRVCHVYGALLNCYAEFNALEKAENIMQKMKELGYSQLLSYNVMMALYSRMGKYDEMDCLMQEMEEKGIECDRYSFNTRLNAYVTDSDIEGMEKLLMKMEVNPMIVMDWNTYVIAAKGYVGAGDPAKAITVLRKCEQLIRGNKVNRGYQVLMTLYARLGNKPDVYRIWDLLRKFGNFRNMDYLSMVSSLEKLDDLEGAEKIMEEWLANMVYFDNRIPNMLVTAYCKRGDMNKAELLIQRLAHSGFKPNASAWSRVARGYFKYNNKEKALEMIKKAILTTDQEMCVDLFCLASCVQYLKEKGETNEAEALIQLLEEQGPFPIDVRDRIMENLNKGNLVLEANTICEGEADENLGEDTLEDVGWSKSKIYGHGEC